eukprot:gene9905-2678_t
MPDQMMARTMRGKIREVTGASGATYRHADGSRWARIDGWWCMEGMAVTMDKRVDAMDLALDITHHRGVGVTWRMPDATTAAAGKGIRVMQRLPAKDDPKWGEYRAKLQREVATAMDEGTGPDGIHKGHHIVKDGYASRKREDCWTTGVSRIEVGGDAVLERWQWGMSSVWA